VIQIVLTFGCALVVAYGLALMSRTPLAGALILAAGLVSLVFAWRPEIVTAAANWLGVGRGTDLVLYLWVIVSTAEFLVLHQKIHRQGQLITLLSRHVALREAKLALPGSRMPEAVSAPD
jgi:hypothetical protein